MVKEVESYEDREDLEGSDKCQHDELKEDDEMQVDIGPIGDEKIQVCEGKARSKEGRRARQNDKSVVLVEQGENPEASDEAQKQKIEVTILKEIQGRF